jgi:hypothetical protein
MPDNTNKCAMKDCLCNVADGQKFCFAYCEPRRVKLSFNVTGISSVRRSKTLVYLGQGRFRDAESYKKTPIFVRDL